jgi:hypothetical protein
MNHHDAEEAFQATFLMDGNRQPFTLADNPSLPPEIVDVPEHSYCSVHSFRARQDFDGEDVPLSILKLQLFEVLCVNRPRIDADD